MGNFAPQVLYAFNRGIVSRLGLARSDIKRIAISAAQQLNWMPRVLGSMMLRAGMGFITQSNGGVFAQFLPFIFATSDTALIELTAGEMRVIIKDVPLTRVAVTAVVTNGEFAANLNGWQDNDEAGCSSIWAGPNNMQFVGNGTQRAIRDQGIAVPQLNTEMALRISIGQLGQLNFRCGYAVGDDALVGDTVLSEGVHSIAFTPTATPIYIRFYTSLTYANSVLSVEVEAAGPVVIATPWGINDIPNVRCDQSGDVVFCACVGYQQRRIERRGVHPGGRSWSLVKYQTPDGPFQLENVSPITLTPSSLSGNITVTSSQQFFKATHIGALFSITSTGQNVQQSITAGGTFTGSIRVTGILTARAFALQITGTFNATVHLQRSYDNATWSDVGSPYSWTAPVSAPVTDGLDNQIVYYRLAVETGDYTSGSVGCGLFIGSGNIRGIVQVTGFINETEVYAAVISPLGGRSGTTTWEQGSWSDLMGWPTSVVFHEGRLFWSGQNGIWGSISDAFNSFDETVIGDSGVINRTIGAGPVDTINWMLSLQRLMLGAQGEEFSVRSSSLDEALTPSNYNCKSTSTQGSGAVRAIKVDQSGIFVDRSGARVYEMAFSLQTYDYTSTDLTALVPDLAAIGIKRVAVQRKPDTRVHCVLANGQVMVGVIDKDEDVLAWILIQTLGNVEDVVVLPALSGNLDDQVYYSVARQIGGVTTRSLEKVAQESQCRGDQALCMLSDSYISQTFGTPQTVIPNLAYLNGLKVAVWADGADVGTATDGSGDLTYIYTVIGGQIVLPVAATNVVVGLPYLAQFQSTKLGVMTQRVPLTLNMQKKIHHLGLVMANVHSDGVRYGPEFTYLDQLPLIEDGTLVGSNVMTTDYDQNTIEFPGEWTTDSRVCLQAQSPRPVTILAMTFEMEVNE